MGGGRGQRMRWCGWREESEDGWCGWREGPEDEVVGCGMREGGVRG